MWTKAQHIYVARSRTDLKNVPGAYELGYLKDGQFKPKYIGRARTCLHTRLTSYASVNRCHNVFLLTKLLQERSHIYFRLAQVSDPAFFEAQRLYRYEIGRHGGMYEWNQKYEYQAMRRNGWEFVGD